MPTTPASIDQIGFSIADTARLFRRRYQELTREVDLGLNKSHSGVLLQLERRRGKPINQATLAKRLEIEPMTLVPLLDHLEQAGLIERRPDPGDRRARLLFLKPEAEVHLKRIHEIASRLFSEAMAGLDETRQMRLTEDLALIKSNILQALNEKDDEASNG